MHIILVNHLGSLPRNCVVRLTYHLVMTIVVDCDVNPQIKQTKQKVALWASLTLHNPLHSYFDECQILECIKNNSSSRHTAAPVAKWLRTLIFSALSRSSSHRCGFEPSLGHVRQTKVQLVGGLVVAQKEGNNLDGP